jgi:flagellar biosynthesis protein FliO
VSPPALARRPFALLFPLVGALLVLGVLGPNLRGAAAATLVAAGALLLGLRGHSAIPIGPRQLQIVDRVDLGPRQVVVLVETAGRRYLVTTGASVTLLPPAGEG